MGSRTRGRPPTRWVDDVENDLKTLNIKNWQRVAAYRWNWKKRAVEAAKTCIFEIVTSRTDMRAPFRAGADTQSISSTFYSQRMLGTGRRGFQNTCRLSELVVTTAGASPHCAPVADRSTRGA
ncbi:hypothetical protein TNCV_1721631 [Trichonephila clavipes]|nr:hypothetical protein TNCV_1721631 [Trichonephila clavipes]